MMSVGTSAMLHWITPAISDEDFERMVRANPELRFERTAEGDLLVTPPTGSEAGRQSAALIVALGAWNESEGEGMVFDAQAGFTLPDSAIRSPDASWIERSRWEALTPARRLTYAPICPDAVFELLSHTDGSDRSVCTQTRGKRRAASVGAGGTLRRRGRRAVRARSGFANVKRPAIAFALALAACQPALPPAATIPAAPALQRATFVIVGNGFRHPGPLAVDGNGNVYVADAGAKGVRIVRVSPPFAGPSHGRMTTIASFPEVSAIAASTDGDLYVASTHWPYVEKIGRSRDAVKIGAHFDNPTGIAVDGRSDVYVTDAMHQVTKVEPPFTGSSRGTLAKVPIQACGFVPNAVAVDAAGDVYVSYPADNIILLGAICGLTPAGATIRIGSPGDPAAVAVNPKCSHDCTVYGIESALFGVSPPFTGPTDGTVRPIADGLANYHTTNVAADVFGNVYVDGHLNGLVREIPASQER